MFAPINIYWCNEYHPRNLKKNQHNKQGKMLESKPKASIYQKEKKPIASNIYNDAISGC
jgi:NADH:ubiquinone oxidoreductase subunit